MEQIKEKTFIPINDEIIDTKEIIYHREQKDILTRKLVDEDKIKLLKVLYDRIVFLENKSLLLESRINILEKNTRNSTTVWIKWNNEIMK